MTNEQSDPTDSGDEITPNPQQKAAIEANEKRLRIVAGPGTGKTETLTRRIAHLIEKRGADPESIVAFTFTEKAANELLTRVENRVGSLETRPWVGTIHSFCLDLLEEYREEVFEGDHTILGDEGQFVFLYTHYNDLELEGVRFPLHVVAAHFSKLMDLGVEPEKYVQFAQASYHKISSIPEHRTDRASKLQDAEDRLAVAKSYIRYHEKMDETDSIDYATMIQQALDLVEANQEVRRELKSQFEHLLVDEYQDTNGTQESLVHEISSLDCSLTVVGDDDQSIYRFRGATVDNLLEFDERFESVKTIPIETNYRSNKDIISASQSVIQNNERRLQKSISADSCDDGMVGHIHKQDATSEAAAVCDFIENSLESGRIDTPADVALLFRSVRRDAGRYTEALRQRGLPIEVTGLADIFDNEQVSAILSVADYLLGEVTEREVANLAVAKFCGDAQKEFVAGNLPSCGHAHCQKTAESLFELNSEYDGDSFVNPKEFFYEILSSFPIFEKLAGDTSTRDSTEQLRYLAGLSDVIGQIGEITEYTSLGYLRQILSLVQDQGVEPDISAYDGGIQIMTVHQAKGLEFDTVIIPSLNNGKFPNADRPDPLQIPSQLRSEPEYKSGDDHLSDERRLFYVAMTRAESRLILSSNGDSEISDFVSEIEKESIDRISPRPEIAEYDKRFSLQRQDKIESTSFTQISYYIQCPLKYGLLFDYGFERTDQPQFFYGISVHRALERFFRAIEGDLQSTESHLIEALDTEWIDRGYAGEEQEQRFRQKAESILLNFLHQHGDELNRIAYVEHPFSILENGVRVEGKMDRVDRLPSGKLRIIDFKVGETKEPGPWESFQLQLYALACERTLDEEIADCKFHYLSSDEQVSIEYNDSVQKETLSRLRSVLNKMSNREYTPSPGSYCDRCDFRGFCPAVE